MRLGICLTLDNLEVMNEKFEFMKKENLMSCQLISWNPQLWTDESLQTIKTLQKEGVEISAFWCGYEEEVTWNFYEGQKNMGLLPSKWRAKRIQNLCDGADFARKFGIINVVTHIGFIPEDPNLQSYKELCDAVKTVANHLKDNKQMLLLETGQETPVTLVRCIEDTGCENVGINLDPANLIMYGKANPADAIEMLWPYVKGMHAKDGLYPVNGHDLGKETKIGEGKVDFKTILRKLKETGYSQPITIEREISGEQQTKDILFAKDYLMKIWNEV